jgi:hypothetical protein
MSQENQCIREPTLKLLFMKADKLLAGKVQLRAEMRPGFKEHF